MHEKIQRFSLRKLSVGLASVAIGACIFSVNGKNVKADVTSDQTTQKADVQGQTATTQPQNEKKQASSAQNSVADQSQKNLLDDLDKQKASTENNQAEAKNQENRLVDQINYKLTNNTSTDPKEDLGQNLTAPDETKSNPTTKSDAEKSIVGSSSIQQTNNQSNNHADDNSQSQNEQKLDITKNSQLAKKVLATNLIETNSSPMTNGGFDEATWGKLDVNDWKGSVQGDYYQLTDYTGDANHVIVPNEADFTKAGISTSGKQVGVTSYLMYSIFRDKATAQDATVAFSKTGNQMVKAIDTGWNDTWGHKYYNASKAKLSKFDGTNLDVSNVTNMNNMFEGNQISDLSPLAKWNVNNVTDMSYMFLKNQISDLSPLTNWKVDNVKDMSWMFGYNQIDNLSPLANWKVDNVTNMNNMFERNQISDLSPLANWNVNNVTNMNDMFGYNQIDNLSPLANWNVNNVTNMNNMFDNNQISDLSPLTNWKVDNVKDMSWMFGYNQIDNLSPLANWHTNNVTDMSNMLYHNRISDLSPLANLKVYLVTNMSEMFGYNQISNLSPLAKWDVSNVTDMFDMFDGNQIRDLSPLANWKVDNVTNMIDMFYGNYIRDLSPLSSWKVDNVTDMSGMFSYNQIDNLSPLANWNTGKVTDMSYMFRSNRISDLSPLSNWNVNNVTNMNSMFDRNYSTQTKNLQAKRVISFVYPDGYTGKTQDHVTQTIDVPQRVKVELITKDSKPSNNILDWVTKKETPETPEAPDPVYFLDYTVPTVANLVPNISTVAKAQADPNKPINVTVTYTASPVTVHFFDVDENANKDSDAVKQELGKTVSLTGKYGDKIDLMHVIIPDGFKIDDTSTSNTFGNTTDAYINLKHQHTKSTAQAPATRTIVVHMPDGSTKTYVQTIGFVNNLDKDLVTNKTTNIYTVDSSKSNVTVNDQVSTQYQAYVLKDGVVNYAPIKLPHINGYKVKLIQDKANPAMFMVSFFALPQQNNQSNNVQSSQKPIPAEQNQPEPIQTTPVKDKQTDQIIDHIAFTLMHDSSDTADSFEPVQNNSDSFEAPSDSTQKDDAAKPQKVNAAKHKKHIVKKHVIKHHKKHAKKYRLKRRSRKHSKRSKKRIIKHRKSVSRKFRKHNLKHVKKN